MTNYDKLNIMLILSVTKAILGWFILTVASTNLLGLFVRGIANYRQKDTENANPALKSITAEFSRAKFKIAILSIFLTGVYFYIVFRFWGILATTSAMMLMISRLPDLLLEIKVGRKLTKRELPRGFVYAFASVLAWVTLPVLWWSIYNRQ